MKKLIFIFLFAILLPVTAASQKAQIGATAPDFTLMDSYSKMHNLESFRGKVVVLEWINFDCPFVEKHYDSKNMQRLQKEYRKKGVVWLSICSSAKGKQGNFEKDEINEKIKEHGANPTAYLIDESGEVGKLYGAKTTPHMFIINKMGNLVYAGGIDDKPSTDKDDIKDARNYIKAALDQLLSGSEITVKKSKPYGCSVKY